MKQYPYTSPQILTDTIFLLYGGQTGTSTAAQRQAVYLMAEEQMTEHLSSFLVPTVITGTAMYAHNRMFSLEFGNILNLHQVNILTIKDNDPLTTQIYTGTALVRNAQYGYIDLYTPTMYGAVNSVSVVYESGLGTGTYTQPTLLTALALAAQINLNEIDVSLSNESTSDIGVQQFSNQSYSEMRVKLGSTVFGNSAIAQRVERLVRKYRARPGIGLR